jgi:WD40 repeat protein
VIFWLQGHTADVVSVRFSPDGRFLMSGDRNGKIVVWERQAQEDSRLVATYNTVYEVGHLLWLDTRRILIVDKGGPSGNPRFYCLVLEGVGK